jgi:hypothetical protein
MVLLALSAPAFAQGKAPDACTVVTKADIEQALGVTLDDGVKGAVVPGTGVISSCDYKTVPGGGTVQVRIRQDPPTYSRSAEKVGLQKAGMKLRAVQGIGSEAFIVDMLGTGSQLTAFRGPRDAVQVTATGLGEPKAREAGLQKITRLVFDRWK